MFTLRFDMRAPATGAPAVDLYAAAPDMCAWAEQHGCLAAVLCEHHGSEDGYLPSPLILASAIASRTERLMLSLVMILPFYDPFGSPRTWRYSTSSALAERHTSSESAIARGIRTLRAQCA